jgi:hypothetical protein
MLPDLDFLSSSCSSGRKLPGSNSSTSTWRITFRGSAPSNACRGRADQRVRRQTQGAVGEDADPSRTGALRANRPDSRLRRCCTWRHFWLWCSAPSRRRKARARYTTTRSAPTSRISSGITCARNCRRSSRRIAADAKPPRAAASYQQQIVAGQIELPRPPQLIRVPAPRIPLAQPLKLPNLLRLRAVRNRCVPSYAAAGPRAASPKIARCRPHPRFTAVPPRELALDLAAPRPRPLPFIPPAPRKIRAGAEQRCRPRRWWHWPRRRRTCRAFRAALAHRRRRRSKPAAEPALATDRPSGRVPPSSQSTLAIVGLNPIALPRFPNRPEHMRPASRLARARSRKAARRLRPARPSWCPI